MLRSIRHDPTYMAPYIVYKPHVILSDPGLYMQTSSIVYTAGISVGNSWSSDWNLTFWVSSASRKMKM